MLIVDTTPDSEPPTWLFWVLSAPEPRPLMPVTVDTPPFTELLRFEIVEFWVLSDVSNARAAMPIVEVCVLSDVDTPVETSLIVETTPESELLTWLLWVLSELEMPVLMPVTVETASLTEVLKFEIVEVWVLSDVETPVLMSLIVEVLRAQRRLHA